MLENQVDCDVTFYVGKQKEDVNVHKYVLVSRSSVFYAMLCGPLHETGPINIPDIEPDVFKQLLSFIYFEAFEPDGDSILALLYAAKKYAVKSLVDKCVNRLEKEVSLDNVCDILQQAHALDENDLRRKCLEYIIDNGSYVLKHSSFGNLSAECVEMVVSHDELCAEEDEVYEALKHWAETECAQRNIKPSTENIRQVLGGLKNLIRFSVMDGKYFADKVAADNILTVDEKLTFLRNFLSNGNYEAAKNIQAARKPRFQEMQRVIRFSTYGPASSTGSIVHAIEFRCSKKVLMHGIILYGATESKINCYNCGLVMLVSYYCSSCGGVMENKRCCSNCGVLTLQYFCNHCGNARQSKNYCNYCRRSGQCCHNCGCWQESSIPNEITSDTVVQLLDEFKHMIISMKCQRTTAEKELVEVLFDDPVVLKPNWYTITLAISSSNTACSGVNGEKVVGLGDGQSVEFRDSSLSSTDTNVSRGQIPGLLLSRRR
ncbi:hypothetical protein CHS0354_020325 [Potamilus streckersoni]|uniref:BTB domain-containing protein n=1 Tax=Potamilus streckersoni TaxID=2493646 RepID=A0AAE0VVR4_9BIVA|nr:hypothetical protein CHS0354_020325 [Potamilus streckersoni]